MRTTPPVNAQAIVDARAITAVLKNIKKGLTWQWGQAGDGG